jgi:hypothetical protein
MPLVSIHIDRRHVHHYHDLNYSKNPYFRQGCEVEGGRWPLMIKYGFFRTPPNEFNTDRLSLS